MNLLMFYSLSPSLSPSIPFLSFRKRKKNLFSEQQTDKWSAKWKKCNQMKLFLIKQPVILKHGDYIEENFQIF